MSDTATLTESEAQAFRQRCREFLQEHATGISTAARADDRGASMMESAKKFQQALAAAGLPAAYLAKRFAAKEAASKAFGTGIGAEFALTSVGVLNGPEGEPIAELDDKARALLAARGATRLLLSLTHPDTLAQAFVVLVR